MKPPESTEYTDVVHTEEMPENASEDNSESERQLILSSAKRNLKQSNQNKKKQKSDREKSILESYTNQEQEEEELYDSEGENNSLMERNLVARGSSTPFKDISNVSLILIDIIDCS